MARKSVKGYAEKNYYDNTKFTGGIVATNDPLNEGSFKHLVNFDIADTGQSLTPRKGFLTTSLRYKDHGTYVEIPLSSRTIYYFDANIGKWVFIDFNNPKPTVETIYVSKGTSNAEYFMGSTKEEEYIFKDNDSVLSYTGTGYNRNFANGSSIIYRFDFTKRNTDVTVQLTYLTEPKVQISFDGETFKDITLHLYNFNTTVPTNTLYIKVTSSNESVSTISYMSLVSSYNLATPITGPEQVNNMPGAYIVEFDVSNNYIQNVHHIANIDMSSLPNVVWRNIWGLPEFIITNKNEAELIHDEYGVTRYLIKVNNVNNIEYTLDTYWLTFTYRETETEFEGKVYSADTLVIECLDTEDVVDTVNTANRNLASFKSIIPDPMQVIYENGKEPLGFIQQFPMIYAKQDGKYLINTTQKVDGLEIIPNFYLKEPVNNTFEYTDELGNTEPDAIKYEWAYTYDVISTSQEAELLGDSKIHRSNIHSIKDNSILYTTDPNATNVVTYLNNKSNTIFTDYSVPSAELDWATNAHTIFNTWSYNKYETYLDEFDILLDTFDNPYREDTLLIYIVPKPSMDKQINLPAAMLQVYDRIELLQTTWYNNSRYNMKEESVMNIPGITESLIYFDGESLQDKFPSIDFSKNEYISGLDDSTSIYQYVSNKYSIYYGANCEPLNNHINNNLKDAIQKYLEDHDGIISTKNLSSLIKETELDDEKFWFYAQPFSEVKYNYTEDVADHSGYASFIQTALHASLMAFKTKGMSVNELESYLNNNKYNKILFKGFEKVAIVNTPKADIPNNKHMKALDKLLPKVLQSPSTYYVYFTKKTGETNIDINKQFVSGEYRTDSILNHFAVTEAYYNETLINYIYPDILTFLPHIKNKDIDFYEVRTDPKYSTLFTLNTYLSAHLSDTNSSFLSLRNDGYFDQGININMYLLLMPTKKYLKQYYPEFNSYTRDYFVNTTSLVQTRQLSISHIKPTTYVEYLTEEPTLIKNAKENFIFRSTLGDHLVVYAENKLYISKESKQYYFPATGYSFSYPETIVKAIQYKDMILVFTTQNLYAVYLTEYVTTVQNGTDDQGNPKYVQQSTYEFATLPVLYNLMVDERYKDAIQVYNQMILFYSADGQMFLIKPTAAIDSNTRFSIQYFNKSVNDILLNYKDYMQERLNVYKVDKVITDVKIKVSTSINFIKIFYTAPDIMTYILIYDIINNRYYVYDTLLFSNIVGLHFIPEGELYVVEDKNRIYFTLPYAQPNEPDNNVDIASYDNFSRNAIKSEIDTGVINLNNHLKKRFKDLHVIYKNLNATDLEFSLDTFIDDVPIITYLDSSLEIRNVSSHNTIVSEDYYNTLNLLSKNINSFSSADYNSTKFVVHNTVDFLEDNTVLFNFTDYTSNKVITHRSNIVSKGKAIRTKMYFTSKGKYKIQGYGLVYKEHTV